MRWLIVGAALVGSVFGQSGNVALADSNITCNNSGNVSYCGGTQDGVFYSYNCTDYGYELDCVLVSPYYYHWTINRY